jgi:hypothetical protein
MIDDDDDDDDDNPPIYAYIFKVIFSHLILKKKVCMPFSSYPFVPHGPPIASALIRIY